MIVTYAVALKRSTERYNHISKHLKDLGLKHSILGAVDAKNLTPKEIEKNCDPQQLRDYREWISDGAIACALSHLEIYKAFLASNDKSAFIVEDDVILPKNISEILEDINHVIDENEIILLYATSRNICPLSTVGHKKVKSGQLVFPMNIEQPISAAAYMIGRKAAEGMVNSIIPIQVTADCWYHYLRKNAFSSLRVHYPEIISTKNFKSSIDYFQGHPLKSKLLKFIYDYKVPVLSQYLNHKRLKNLNSITGNFVLTDEISPVQIVSQ